MYQEFFDEALKLHKAGEFQKAIGMYNRLLNRAPFDTTLQFMLADAFSRAECNGIAINLLHNLLQEKPDFSEAWCNLGVAYRKEDFFKQAETSWNKAIELSGDSVEVCSNMASMFADHGEPEKTLEWCKRALACDPENNDAHWHKSLAYLTMGNFVEGFEEYEHRRQLAHWDSRKNIDVQSWDGTYVDHLYIHGEQGVGDEIMFLSLLDEVKPLVGKVTLELNKKVIEIAQLTWPCIEIVETEQEAIETGNRYDAKIPIGSLARMFRKNGFPGLAYLKPDHKKVEFYKNELRKLGKPPYIGLAWIGGMKSTRISDRSLNLAELKPFMDKYTCVSVQYSDTNPMIDPERQSLGLVKLDDSCIGKNLADQAALFMALDAVVTVQQTAVHVAGATGTPCYAMIPHNPQWRYGLKDTMPWYSSVKLFRKPPEAKWAETVQHVMERLDVDFAGISKAAA